MAPTQRYARSIREPSKSIARNLSRVYPNLTRSTQHVTKHNLQTCKKPKRSSRHKWEEAARHLSERCPSVVSKFVGASLRGRPILAELTLKEGRPRRDAPTNLDTTCSCLFLTVHSRKSIRSDQRGKDSRMARQKEFDR